jgi:hypothetical protein
MWSAAADVGRLVKSKRHAKSKSNYLQGSDRAQEASRIPLANPQDQTSQNEQESYASDSATSDGDGNGELE